MVTTALSASGARHRVELQRNVNSIVLHYEKNARMKLDRNDADFETGIKENTGIRIESKVANELPERDISM